MEAIEAIEAIEDMILRRSMSFDIVITITV
jgi:hypothetical protein